jgi:predicted branched-subunit amino acid permease
MLDKKSFIDGLYGSIPICLAFTLLYSSLGLMGNASQLSLFETTFLSATIFAGPSQVFVMDNQDLSLWVLILNIFVLNFKFVLMSSMILPYWQHRKRLKIPGLYFMCSSAYLVCVTKNDVKDPWSYYMGVVLISYVIAVVFTILGYIAWDKAADYRTFLNAIAHIVLPIHFVCLIIKRKKEHIIVATSLFGIAATPVLENYIGKQMLILAWFSIAFMCVFIEDKFKQKNSEKKLTRKDK